MGSMGGRSNRNRESQSLGENDPDLEFDFEESMEQKKLAGVKTAADFTMTSSNATKEEDDNALSRLSMLQRDTNSKGIRRRASTKTQNLHDIDE